MVRKYKKLVKESRGSVYDMINAIEDRIDELENGYYDESVDLETVPASKLSRKNRYNMTRNNMQEGKSMPYVLWVLDGDDGQWKMYKGVNDARKFVAQNDHDEFLDQLNTQVYPNETYYNNYTDWVVIPAGEDPETFNTYNENVKTGSKRLRRRLKESSRKKYTQTQLRSMVRDGKAEDITNYSFEEANDLYDRGYDVIGVSTGTYGINGALLKMRDTGDLMVICARNSTLM